MSGLIRFGYRDYLPEIGKWTAKDPIDFGRLEIWGTLYLLILNSRFIVTRQEVPLQISHKARPGGLSSRRPAGVDLESQNIR